MAMQCESCRKGVQYGHNVSHSKRRTLRTFKPNLQSTKVIINGASKRVKLCTKCLRMYKRVTSTSSVQDTSVDSAQVTSVEEVAPVAV